MLYKGQAAGVCFFFSDGLEVAFGFYVVVRHSLWQMVSVKLMRVWHHSEHQCTLMTTQSPGRWHMFRSSGQDSYHCFSVRMPPATWNMMVMVVPWSATPNFSYVLTTWDGWIKVGSVNLQVFSPSIASFWEPGTQNTQALSSKLRCPILA